MPVLTGVTPRGLSCKPFLANLAAPHARPQSTAAPMNHHMYRCSTLASCALYATMTVMIMTVEKMVPYSLTTTAGQSNRYEVIVVNRFLSRGSQRGTRAQY